MSVKIKKKLFLTVSIVFILIILLVFALFLLSNSKNTNTNNTEGLSKGIEENQIIPTIKATSFDGKAVNTSDFKGEKSLILTTMATWCASCIQNSVDLNTAIKNSGRDDIAVIAITVDPTDNDESLKNFYDKYAGEDWYVLPFDAGTPKVVEAFKMNNIDLSWVINKDGVIVDTYNWPRSALQWQNILLSI
ncbi:MAG TPA: redoxin domain-containing protein [bacterium]|nr:redoxin domain-containing protein [bacterium]